jgi:DNA-binding winged helix-turn-helix (wHTH) protein
MHVLLIENSNLDQAVSLLPNLEKRGCHVWLAHTPEATLEQTATLWPNLIVFNPSHNQVGWPTFRDALAQTDLNIPWLIVGDKSHLPAEGNHTTDVTLVGLPRLKQGLEKATIKQKERFVRLPQLVVDRQQHRLLHNGVNHTLTPKEFKLLSLFLINLDQILSRKLIMQQVWETDYMGDTRTLDVHIRWLRKKIEQNPSRPRRLVTMRGVGYRFLSEIG